MTFYHLTQGSLGTLGTPTGNNPSEFVFKLLFAEGPLLYIGGHENIWAYDAVRGGIHMLHDANLTNGHFHSGIMGPDGPYFAHGNDVDQQKLIKLPHSKATDVWGTAPSIESNYFDFSIPGEKKWVTEVTLMTDGIVSGETWTIATSVRRNDPQAAISPQGRWVAYTLRGANYNASLWLHDLQTRQAFEVTGEYADIGAPTFSRDGKLLFFTASTNAGPTHVGLDMSSQQQPYRAGIYAAILEADGDNPLAPAVGDEQPEPEESEGDGENGEADHPVVVDPAGIARRIVALPVAKAFLAISAATS